MPNIIIDAPLCPACRGQMYDNRDSKKNPKSPDFRCKDKGCVDDKGFVTGLWEKDIAKTAPAPARPVAPARQAFEAGPRIAGLDPEQTEAAPSKLDGVLSLHDVCVMHASTHTAKLLKAQGFTPSAADILAAAATQMIGAQKVGASA